jgi:hypothetical protein
MLLWCLTSKGFVKSQLIRAKTYRHDNLATLMYWLFCTREPFQIDGSITGVMIKGTQFWRRVYAALYLAHQFAYFLAMDRSLGLA